MKSPSTYILVILINAILALADWQFRSRPDLSPPRLNITIPATKEVAPGYIFVTPYPSFADYGSLKPEQPGAYIFRNDGDLIWSSLGYLGGWIGNLQVARYKGQTVLQAFQGTINPFHGHGYGTAVLLDQSYQHVKTVQSQDSKLISIHEFRIVDERTALFEIYQPIVYDLTAYGGNKDGWIVDGIFQEIDIETGEVIFEAHSLDFADPSESITPLNSDLASGKTSANAWDYFHLNSVDKDNEGNYLVSGRHTSKIYKLSGKDGSLIWKLTGHNSSPSPSSPPTFHLQENITFGYQHDARFLSLHVPNPNPNTPHKIETISLFDNSARSSRTPNGEPNEINPTSSARIIQLNHTSHTATQLTHFLPPNGEPIIAASQGNAQTLTNGNLFINWGQAGAVTEYTSHGEVIFQAYLDSVTNADKGRTGGAGLVQSYRGFRYEWRGVKPRERPAIFAGVERGKVKIWVSWNGDTETVRWRFWGVGGALTVRSTSGGGGDLHGRRVELGVVERRSFETGLVVSEEHFEGFVGIVRGMGGGGYEVFAEALDKEGNVIGTSRGVAVHGVDGYFDSVEERDKQGEDGLHVDL